MMDERPRLSLPICADPLIDDVRRRRGELFESLGGSVENLFEAIQRLQRSHPEKVARPTRSHVAQRGSNIPD